MQKDVFFLDHQHKENGTEDSVSKYNMYEVSCSELIRDAQCLHCLSQVNMVKDLVLYFLRQGTYNGPGDIAVLCAYLGQLMKVRAALRDLKIAVAIDERDADQIARQGLDDEVEMEEVLVAKHVSLCLSPLEETALSFETSLISSSRSVLVPSISSKGRKPRSSSFPWSGTQGRWTVLPRL